MRTVAIIFLFGIQINALTQNFETGNQEWIQYYFQYNGDKKNIGFDIGYRRKNFFQDPASAIVRGNIMFNLNSNNLLGGGILLSENFVSTNHHIYEFRPYQEFLFKEKKERFNFGIRLRVEERIYRDVNLDFSSDTYFDLRLRVALINNFRIYKSHKTFAIWFNITEEIFVNFPIISSHNWFDQNRVLLGPMFSFNEKWSTQMLYNFQISPSVISDFKLTNVFWFSIKHQVYRK